ncbi:MAG: DEAD/DEAH box helicase [Ilumatobacter sp.]|uniref:DEAD/DEAH box helicase n=1 Tax=Ilumatobacter sp. TaxID=1967498 RepID=UPI003296C773
MSTLTEDAPVSSDAPSTVSFADLGLPEAIVDALEARGMTAPFAIQAAVIPDALDGRDVAGRAPTGSGKTLGFGLPIVAGLTKAKPKRPVALVLAPTRELAEQIMAELTPFTKAMRFYATSIYGGVGYGNQKNALNKGTELVVACPGRLEDLMQMGAIDLRDVTQVVIDEADQMADMGFLPAVRRIVGQTSPDRQVMLFSATLDGPVAKLIKDFQHDPVRHEVGPKGPDIHAAHHVFWQMDRADRNDNTAGVIESCGSTIVFTRTRHGADRLSKQLLKLGVSAQPIHGGRSQNQRDRALDAFKQGKASALIATDVAARGIHVNGVNAVIHYDPPADGATYHHRSGRTARAGASGIVVSFVERNMHKEVKKLQKEVGIQVDVTDPDLDDLEVTLLLLETEAAARGDVVETPVRSTRTDSADDRPAPRERKSENRRRDSADHDGPEAPQRKQQPESNAPIPTGHEVGTVKFFNASRGYGFIVRDSGRDELFVHFSSIESEGFKTLDENARVSYAVGQGKKGPEATHVRVR